MNDRLCYHFDILLKSTNIVQLQSFSLLNNVEASLILAESKGDSL